MFVLRFVKLLNKVASRVEPGIDCLHSKSGSVQRCWGGEMVALLHRPVFRPAFCWLALSLGWSLSHGFIYQVGKPKPRLLKEEFPH